MADTVTNAARLLIIDDDTELCDLLGKYLHKDGLESECVHLGRAGIERVASNPYALVILDVMLPDLNGFDVLKGIRQQRRTPVLMLTARGDEIDRIVGLELGADDYLPKPFNPRELLARIHAILHRTDADMTGFSGRQPVITIDDVTLRPNAHRASRRSTHRVDQHGIRPARSAAAPREWVRGAAMISRVPSLADSCFPMTEASMCTSAVSAESSAPAPTGASGSRRFAGRVTSMRSHRPLNRTGRRQRNEPAMRES